MSQRPSLGPRLSRLVAVMAALGGLVASCGGADRSATEQAARAAADAPAAAVGAAIGGLRAVSLPNLARVDASVKEQLVERDAELKAVLAKPGSTDAEKAAAFGALAVLLHAAEYYEAAEPAYLNAQALASSEPKWPYLLSHLHKSRGQPDQALVDLTRTLEIAPNDVAALIWLGRMHLDRGQPEKAEPLFERAQSVSPGVAAVALGLGQAALARRDYSRAVTVLEGAIEAGAPSSLRSPLAMAYRGLGDTAKAEAHLRQWRNTEVLVPDPMRQELDLSLQSGLSFELRGVRALESRDFKAAESFFRQGVAITDGGTMLGRSLRHKLGTALFFGGDLRGAVDLFRETVRLAPKEGRDETAAKAHYSLGVLMASAGLGLRAIEHLTAAVSYNPTYVEAVLALADALRRAGRVEQSLGRYQEVLKINPRSAEARGGYGMGLVRLGRFREARTWFEEQAAQPDGASFRHALARLLVAAPDDGVRDGPRGLNIVQDLLANAPERTTDMGETFAMALAEAGDYTQAASVQRDVLAAAARAGLAVDARRMTRNLRLFEGRRPSREPWSSGDPVHLPGPPVDASLRTLLQ